MTPRHKIMLHILREAIERDEDVNYEGDITEESIEELYEDLLVNNDLNWDLESEFRSSGEDSGIPDRYYSRHYECKEVARQLNDGTWIGWTYWFGGGKHGEPESIEWMEDAYEVEVKEEQRIVRIFSKKD